jgi:hypothetical protein
LKDKAEHCNDVAALQAISVEADVLKLRCLNEIAETEEQMLPKPQPPIADPIDNGGDTTITPPAPKPIKKRKSISIKSINTSATWQIETEDDVRKYISELETKLISSLEENTVINIEF